MLMTCMLNFGAGTGGLRDDGRYSRDERARQQVVLSGAGSRTEHWGTEKDIPLVAANSDPNDREPARQERSCGWLCERVLNVGWEAQQTGLRSWHIPKERELSSSASSDLRVTGAGRWRWGMGGGGEGERDVRIIVSAPVVVRVRVAILRKACECSHFCTVKRGCFLLKFQPNTHSIREPSLRWGWGTATWVAAADYWGLTLHTLRRGGAISADYPMLPPPHPTLDCDQ